ncbi:hypothetical protein P12x_004813 [Tundrisphaera lichenicola]|uniref:hypothetical protein n=1 Tax=Tundrisphaera lichenicola TaxID=2029860 RepID=UPI003EB6E05C
MTVDDLEPCTSSVLLSILRPGPEETEVEFDDFVTKIRVRLAPADEESGAVVGLRMTTLGGTRSVLVMLTPTAAADLASRISSVVLEADLGCS